MEKVLIEIYLPAAKLKQDFFVPETMQTGLLAVLAGQVFTSLAQGQYRSTGRPILCWDNGEVLDPNQQLMEAGFQNGSSLILY